MAEGKAKRKGTGVENSSSRVKTMAMDQASSSQKLVTALSYLPLPKGCSTTRTMFKDAQGSGYSLAQTSEHVSHMG